MEKDSGNPISGSPVSFDGATLRYARQKAGVSPRHVSAWLGVHPATLFSWERNERIPPADKFLSLLLLYNLLPDEVYKHRVSVPPLSSDPQPVSA